MNRIIGMGITLFMGSSIVLAGTNLMKKYDIKGGKVEYALKGSGNVMGMVQIQSVGKKRIIFDDYGAKSLEEEVKVTKETTRGKTQTKKSHTLNYMNSSVMYKVDFKKKTINRMKNRGAAMAAMLGGGKDLKESGEKMMKSMGGKKLGTDKVLGYTCDVWELMGSKQCIYKGIPLRVETDIMGMKNTEIATKAEFGLALGKKDFKLPNFPVYDMDMDVLMQGGKLKEVDKSKLEMMDEKDNAKAKVEAKEGAEAMKGLVAGMAALAKSGYDMKSDKELSPKQEQIMQKAMMGAMGGESKMVAKMKKEMLENVEGIEFVQECFGHANTLTEANVCVDEGNQMFHDNQDYLTSWTAQDKKEELKEIEDFKKAIPCIRAAQTMQALQQCLPMLK